MANRTVNIVPTKLDAPKHPKAAKFVALGLFANLKSFKELEARIWALGITVKRGDAFEVFAEAYLNLQRKDIIVVWPQGTEPTETTKTLLLSENIIPRD